MVIKQRVLAFAIVILLFGTVFVASVLGFWKTTNSKIPVKYESGPFKDAYNPADIRGSYSFGVISEVFKIPIEDLAASFAIPRQGDEIAAFQCKELESIYESAKLSGKEVGTESVKIFAALYKGMPIELTETAYLPKPAEAILLKTGNLTDEQKAYVSSHLIDPEIATAPSASSKSEGTDFVKGKTTFNEVLALGVKKDALEKAINATITDTSITIKDFCTENSLEFSTVKSLIQSLIDVG